MAQQRNRFRALMILGVTAALIAVAVSLIASWLLYNRTIDLLTENLRERLLSISITQAANIDSTDLEALQVEADWQKPEWTKVVHQLKRAKDSNPNIVFMYVFRKMKDNPAEMEFVADAESINPYANSDADPTNDVDANKDGSVEPDGADKLQWPGQPYPEAVDIPEAHSAYSGPLTARELYEDTYGQVLSGYAPILDENKNVIAILATDIKAGDFLTVTRQTLAPFLIFISFLVVIILALSGILIFIWRRRAAELAELDKLKSQFLSIASHDMRAPLTAIRNFMSLFMEGTYGAIPEGAREGTQQVFDRATEMSKLVDNYLNVSRIDQGKMKYDFAEADLRKIVADAAGLFKPLADKKGLTFSLALPPEEQKFSIKGDALKLGEVFQLLIDNAIKYTEKGEVRVSLERVAEKGQSLARITIKDSGVGITKETMPKLFQLFSTAEDSKKFNVSSSGVGLYVVKAHVEAHQGHVRAESGGKGKGSSFIVELPIVNT